MPRRARVVMAGVPLHIVQRGNDRRPCFFTDGDRRCFLELLCELAPRTECAIHAYVLMTNHVHLLLTPERVDAASHLMKLLGQRYVQYVNRARGRAGTLWEGRFRSCPVTNEVYLLACHRYIEMNPVRAGLTAAPEDHPWSSHGANALGWPDRIVTPHPIYCSLAPDPPTRRLVYRALFAEQLAPEVLESIRHATRRGTAIGTPPGRTRFRMRAAPPAERHLEAVES